METRRYKNLEEFYPFYLTEHQNPISRILHFTGTSLFIIIVIFALASERYSLLLAAPVAGYSFAWIGHFFFEKNKPATFEYPAMSLASDFIMFWHIITGQFTSKLKEAREKINS